MGRTAINITGQKFGRLTVLKRAENTRHGAAKWLCQCDCGNKVVVKGSSLRNGTTKSCGCLYRHGKTKTRLYFIWSHIKDRCCNPNCKDFSNYGGRGIKICREWQNDFQAFYDWAMSHGYKENLEIERINNNGNYEPLNCRWATRKEQANNKRSNHLITYNGRTQTISQWADEMGINYTTLKRRINQLNWSAEKALTKK